MAKCLLNQKKLEDLLTEVEGLEQFTSIEKILKEAEDKINDDLLCNTSKYLTYVDEKLYNGTYKLFKVYVDIYSDIEKIYSLKTYRCYKNICVPYHVRVSIFFNHEQVLYYGGDRIRDYKIISIEK